MEPVSFLEQATAEFTARQITDPAGHMQTMVIYNLNIYALAVIDTILFASVPGGFSFTIYRSTDNGANWEQVNHKVNRR